MMADLQHIVMLQETEIGKLVLNWLQPAEARSNLFAVAHRAVGAGGASALLDFLADHLTLGQRGQTRRGFGCSRRCRLTCDFILVSCEVGLAKLEVQVSTHD